MLLEVVSKYLRSVENAVRALKNAYVERYQEEVLVFRYDDTPHFTDISSFPHHKHLHDKVVSSEKPSIITVIEEVKQFTE